MLVPYLYYSDDVGQLARDALLMVLTVSRNSDKVKGILVDVNTPFRTQIAEFIALHTDFDAVLATGLSACYRYCYFVGLQCVCIPITVNCRDV